MEISSRHILLKLPFLSFVFLILLNYSNIAASNINNNPNLTSADEELIQANNKFGLKLFREMAAYDNDSNLFISPFSISAALAMTLNGAKEATLDSLQQSLQLKGLSLENINNSYQNLLRILTNLDSTVIIEIANSIWYNKSLPVFNKFVEINHSCFDAEIRPLDFKPADAYNSINDWVSKKTHGKIRNIANPQMDPLSAMILINAIYFKGDWKFRFELHKTIHNWFYLTDGTKDGCALMTQKHDFDYFENEYFQAIDLPYGDKHYSMAIFLPKLSNNENINTLLDKFTGDNWSIWSSEYSNNEVILYMPKFEIEYNILLNDQLKRLGMGIAFNQYLANFTNMYDANLSNKKAYIDKVIHKSYIKVNESGTEAAAITLGAIIRVSAGEPKPPKPIIMRIDHPFIFVIKERQTNSILFIGKITNPGLLE